jgi:hypothetical protein
VRFRTIFAGILAALIFAALPIGAASAKTFTVPCDSNALITAITNANLDAVKDTINLSAGCNYVLTAPNNTDSDGPNGLPVITTPVNILGNGATISRSTDPATLPFRIVKVDTGGALTTNNLILQNGFLESSTGGGVSAAAGAGILNRGSASFTATSLRNNSVEANNAFLALPIGGAVANASTGTFSMTYGDVTGNSVDTSGACICTPGAIVAIPLGGGIANGGALSINQTSIVGNRATADSIAAFAVGGGISSGGNPSATLDVRGAKVLNNAVETFAIVDAAIGGGIGANTLTMTGTEVGNNQAEAFGLADGTAVGGGIATFGSTSVARSSNIHDNFAGVIANTGQALGGGVANTADLSIVSSAVTANQASSLAGADAFGGGIQTTGSLSVASSTITRNTASSASGVARGGGIYNGTGAKAKITSSTVTGNSASGATAQGGGIYNAGAVGDVTIPASSVTSNSPDNCAPAGSVPGCVG